MKKASPQVQIIPNTQNMLDLVLSKDMDKSKYLAKLKSKKETKIVFFGTPEFSAYILEEFIKKSQIDVRSHSDLLQSHFNIQAVVTRADKPVGRKQIVTASPVALMAKKYGIPIFKPTKLDSDFITLNPALPAGRSTFLTCDLFIVASYGKIIPQNLLDIPKLGAINVHPSLLPNYRGAAPIVTPILNGDSETGVTIMLMDSEMDHGPILATKQVSISKEDNNQTLSNKLMQASVPLLLNTLDKFVNGKIKPKPQNHLKATFTKIIKKEDGFFDLTSPPSPEVLDRMIRAYYPWPGVWTKWNNKIVKFLPEGKVQMEGKKPQTLKDFQNGYPGFTTLF